MRLDAQPDVAGAGALSRKGDKVFALDESTRFTLFADGWLRDDERRIDVVVAPPTRAFGEIAQCDAADRLLRATFALGIQVSGALEVQTLTNVLEREIAVEKDGRRAELAPGVRSTGLQGVGVAGTWTLISPLAASETCAEALASVRQRLQVRVGMGCGG